jgi:hypothetical protein
MAKNKILTILSAAVIVLALVNLASASAIIFNAPTPANASVSTGGKILYNVSIDSSYHVFPENVSLFKVSLYDLSDNLISSAGSPNAISAEGSFPNLQEGTYYLFVKVTLVNGTVLTSEPRFVNVATDLSALYADPTPTDRALINMFDNPFNIKVAANKKADSITAFIFNESGNLVKTTNALSTDSYEETFNLSDGNYSFFANVTLGSSNVLTPTRYIRVHITPPTVSNVAISPAIPSSGLPGTNLSFAINNISSSEIPSRVYSFAELSASVKIRSKETYTFNESSILPFYINISNLNQEGSYSVFLYVSDSDGNIAKVLVGTINIATPSPPGPSGGGSSSSGSGTSGGATTPVGCLTRWVCTEWKDCINGTQTRICEKTNPNCFTNQSKPAEIQNCAVKNETAETPEETKEETQQKKSFLSTITGAVIGTPERVRNSAIIAIVVVLLIVTYIIDRRNRKRSSSSNNNTGKPKKEENGSS